MPWEASVYWKARHHDFVHVPEVRTQLQRLVRRRTCVLDLTRPHAQVQIAHPGIRGAEAQALRARALDIAPDNPRGLMMDAGLLFNAPPERGGSREKGLARRQPPIRTEVIA
jgi:hypothetical protein